jgi:transmembrane sensor
MTRASEISDAAAEWLVRLEAQTSPEIWDEFQAWLDHDPRHRAAFIRLRVAWNRVDILKNMRPVDGTIDWDLLTHRQITPQLIESIGPHPLQGTPRRVPGEIQMPDRRRVLALAAGVAAVGFIGWVASNDRGWTAHETRIGARERIALEDGSTVDLNTNTELRTRFRGGSREIVLARGEALFHVAHDSNRPFYVTAGGTVVRAVGTAFSVRIRDATHVEVLVTEGRVAIGAPSGSGAPARIDTAARLGSAPKVSAGESANVRRNSVSVRSLPPQDATRKLAWTGGHLSFQGETLDEAVQEFNRYNQRQITIVDPTIVNVQVGGVFNDTDPDSFVATLQHLFGIRAQTADTTGDIRLIADSTPPH